MPRSDHSPRRFTTIPAGRAVLFAFLAATCGSAPAQSPGALPRVVRIAPLELKMKLLEQINADRKAHGLQPVEFSEALSRAADEHCREMLTHDYTSHWNRAGWKPYMRYTQAGIYDYTGENIASMWSSQRMEEHELLEQVLASHARFMSEKPPNDGHRQSVLTPGHQRAGIGVAYHEGGLRMIEVFGRSDVELEPIPKTATLRSNVKIKGKVVRGGVRLHSIAVFYEPLPQPMTREQLRGTYSYSLPDAELVERPALQVGQYTDGTMGMIELDSVGRFTLPARFWKREPGVYTFVVWIGTRGASPETAAMTSIFVER